MGREVWSTLAVNDHLFPRNFATDVMLFDRRLFPVPEDGFLPDHWATYDPHLPVELRRNSSEWSRWALVEEVSKRRRELADACPLRLFRTYGHKPATPWPASPPSRPVP